MVWDWASTFIFLPAISKSGRKEIFEIRVEGVPDPEGDAWFYYAKPKDWKVPEGEEYFASFKTIAAGLLQLEGVTNRLPAEFQGFGITAALIPHVAESHAALIRSSRHRPSEGEMRSVAATAVWQRLVREKLAFYDRRDDRFYFPLPPPGAA